MLNILPLVNPSCNNSLNTDPEQPGPTAGQTGRPGLWCLGSRGGAGARVAGLIPGSGRGDPGGLLREKARQKLAGVLAEISTHS